MKANFTPVFNRKDKLNKHGKAPIEIRMYQNRQRRFISTGVFVTPVEWDKKRLEINNKCNDYELLNFQIRELISKYEKAQVEHSLKGKSFSINTLENKNEVFFNGSFVEFVREEIKSNQTLGAKTKVSHTNTVNKLVEFTKTEDIKFEQVNYTFVDNFLNHLRKEKLAINTVHKQHKTLRKYIEIAIKKGYYDLPNPCKDIKVKTEQKKREVLTLEEMQQLEKLDLHKFVDKVSIVRDMFLFSCYTGLRISDATNLKTEYVKKGKEGYELEFVTIKVNKRAEIPLYNLFKKTKAKLSSPETILEKYYNKKNEFVFPRLTEPFINSHLKVIAEEAKILIKVTFHTARHSFGTYMSNKIPVPQLMHLMQHSDIKTTMMYVHMNQELVKQGLQKVDWK